MNQVQILSTAMKKTNQSKDRERGWEEGSPKGADMVQNIKSFPDIMEGTFLN